MSILHSITPDRAREAWSWPARFAARYHSGLASIVDADIAMLDRVPQARFIQWAPVGVAVAFSLLRLGITDIYTESLWFLLFALVLGFLSPVLGVLLVLAHTVLDVIRGFELSGVFFGRIVAAWLLWLLVVEIPLGHRAVKWTIAAKSRVGGAAADLTTKLAPSALFAGLLVFIWTLAVPILIRPVFVWAGVNTPTVPAISLVQYSWQFIAFPAVLAAAIGAFTRVEYGDVAAASSATAGKTLPGTPNLRRVVGALLLVFAMGGIVSGWLDMVLLFAAFMVARPIATRAIRYASVRRLISRTSYMARFVIAFAISFVVARIIMSLGIRPVSVSQFFPLIVSAAIGTIIFAILLDPDRVGAQDEGGDEPVAATAVVGLVLLLAFVLDPSIALADNCSGMVDCYPTATAAAAAGAGAAAAGGWGSGRGRPPR